MIATTGSRVSTARPAFRRFLVVFGLLVGTACGGGSSTEQYTLVCTIDAEKYGLRIDGEKDGDVTVQHHTEKTFFKRSPTGVLESTKVEVNQTLIYASGNAYDFIGEITIDALTDDVTYRITATGDSLAAEQTCTG